MNPVTLIIGYVPLTDTTGKKPSEVRNDLYFKELIQSFDLGDLHYTTCGDQDWKEKINQVNPLIIVVLAGDYFAQQVYEYKKDALLYSTYYPSEVFHRKSETEERKEEHKRVFSEIERMVKEARESGEEKITTMRQYGSMSDKDMYDMIKQALISEDKNLSTKAWNLLNDNHGHSRFVWMRAQLLCEVWDSCDGKGKEEFLCMGMSQLIDEGFAREIDNFTDENGQVFHQYMFRDYYGNDLNYIRRIPFGEKKQNKYEYQAILDKYETPNGLQIMLEAGTTKNAKIAYFKEEAEKVYKMLEQWKSNPILSRKELHVATTYKADSEDDPMDEWEVESFKRFLKKHNPDGYVNLFTE